MRHVKHVDFDELPGRAIPSRVGLDALVAAPQVQQIVLLTEAHPMSPLVIMTLTRFPIKPHRTPTTNKRENSFGPLRRAEVRYSIMMEREWPVMQRLI
jgi:hypothetical protein